MTLILIIIGAAYFILPFLSTPLLFWGIYKDRKNYMWYMSGVILNLAFIGYYYIPRPSNDLYRHFIRMDNLNGLSISEVLSFQPLIIQNLWFYFISVTENYSLLPFSAVILTFYFVLKPLFKFGKKEQISQKITLSFFIIIIVWMHLIWPISGVRNSVAMALFFYGLYQEFILKEKAPKSYIYYLLAALIHYSALILIGLRIFIALFKRINWLFVGGILLWGLFADSIINILNNSNITYLNEVSTKGEIYTGYSNFSNFGLLNLSMKFLFCVIYVLIYFTLKKKENNIFEKYKGFYNYGLVLSLFCIGAFNNLLIVDRFGFLVLSFIPILMMPLLNKGKNKLINSLYIIYYIPFVLLGLYIQYMYLRQASYEINLIEIFTKNLIRLITKT